MGIRIHTLLRVPDGGHLKLTARAIGVNKVYSKAHLACTTGFVSHLDLTVLKGDLNVLSGSRSAVKGRINSTYELPKGRNGTQFRGRRRSANYGHRVLYGGAVVERAVYPYDVSRIHPFAGAEGGSCCGEGG